MALHGEIRRKASLGWNVGHAAPKTLFFDNEPLLSHFVRVYIDPDTLPVLRRVSVKFNRICKIHWKSVFKKACKTHIWFYGDNEHWDGILWERLYVATERNKELVMGVFGGSIESRQAPLSRIDVHNTSLSHQNNVNVSVDVVCGPEATITSQLVTGRQAAASVYDWKLSEIWSLGGFNPATRSALRSVEIFRTDTHTSRSFPIHLKKERCFLGAAIDTDSNIIISGGCSTLYQGAEVYSSLEIYSPGSRNSAFEIIPAKMNVLRGGHQSVYDWRRNRLYCLGGYGGRCIPRINGMGRFVP